MMNKEKLPHVITVVLFVVFIVLGLACASEPPAINPMTRQVSNELGGSLDGFRFMVSTNVTLTLVERSVEARAQTTVQETIVRNIINLTASTRGRLLSGDVNSGLNVYFERNRDGRIPTITFVEKPKQGDKFYFKYENHPSLRNVILYDGTQYQVTWSGNEEPYLLYERIIQERTNQRTMSGVN